MGSAFDFAPLLRSSVGFDRLAHLLEWSSRVDQSGFPPYNIEKLAEDAYRVSLAVAGFGRDDLKVEVREGLLVVAGEAAPDDGGERHYLHRGIAGRSFERTFQLADHVQVTGARLENGLLHVDLARIVPEHAKPRRIGISSGGARPRPSTVAKLEAGPNKAA
jgi:molecular chaperone IbpA